MAATVWRVRDRASFEALAATDRRGRSGPLRVADVATPGTGPPRVAYAINRRAGDAVVRNRIRRRLRAVLSGAEVSLPPGTYLVAASRSASHLPYPALADHLERALVMAAQPPKSGVSRP
jgi:ribonuclease P protein component